MQDYTTDKDGEVQFGEVEFTNLIKMLLRGYRFMNKNNNPSVVIMPNITEVDGVKIRYMAIPDSPPVMTMPVKKRKVA